MSCLQHLDINALPLNTPMLLMTAEGDLLEDDSMSKAVPFVELRQDGRGRGEIEICRSGAPRYFSGGRFHTDSGTSFETLATQTGLVVFESRWREHCMGIATEARSKRAECDKAYEGKWQEWLLLKPILPQCLLPKDLAGASLSDPTARRQLTWCLLEGGNSCETVAEVLELLYGTAEPLSDSNADLSAAERQEQVLQLVNANMSLERVRATLALLYGKSLPLPIQDPTITIKREQPKMESAECDYQFVKVDPFLAGLDAIPLNSPLVMVSSIGSTLNTSETGSCFIELNYNKDEGLVTIRSAADKTKCLVLNTYLQCVFGSADIALKFKMTLSPAGRLVLVEHLTGCVLETEVQGRTKLVVCRYPYSTQSESWLLFTSYDLSPNLTTSRLQKAAYSPDDQRQLIMGFALAGKSSEEVGEVLKLMYGSAIPANTPIATHEVRAERLQQILELFWRKVKMQTIADFLKMMYGTSDPL